MNLYFLMALLFIGLALLEAAGAALTSLGLLPWFNGMRWLRVHLITLGALTEVIFGVLPDLVAIRYGRGRPQMRWDIWFLLNAGILSLLVGIPLVNAVPIFLGGGLIFTATVLLIIQLARMRPAQAKPEGASPARKFYLAGLAYFLLGIIIGTGLWFGWAEALRIQVPLEVHIHANNWGLMSLVFAGLIVDYYPRFAGRPLAWPRSINPIFWMMTLGAFGLIMGPWLQSLFFTVPGLILHLGATLWLVLNMVKPIWSERGRWPVGLWHLITAYLWILAPVLVAPLILLGVPGFPGAGVEANAPQALIYGWVLQFGYGIMPYLFRRVFRPDEEATLGGSRLSLWAVHLGGVFLWAGIFLLPQRGLLHGVAYALWTISLAPIVWQLYRIVQSGLTRLDTAVGTAVGD